MRERVARVAFGLTSALVTYGLVLQLVLVANNDQGRFTSVPARIINTLSFFTVQSNILVAVTTGLLALNLHRRSTVFRVLRIDGLVAIAITGIVFHIALADLHELTGKDKAADWVLHTASPLLCVIGWLVFGPRRQTSWRLVRLSVAFPVLWLAYTMVRGALVKDRFAKHYYPYPFLDVGDHGYLVVTVNIVLVAVLFAALSAAARALDSRLPGVRRRAAV